MQSPVGQSLQTMMAPLLEGAASTAGQAGLLRSMPSPGAGPSQTKGARRLLKDVRHVLDAQRLLVEQTRDRAGAAAVRGAAAGQRVRFVDDMVRRNVILVRRAREEVARTEPHVEHDISSVETNVSNAAVSAAEAEAAVNEARALVHQLMTETVRLARATIAGNASAAAKEEAKAYQEQKGRDRPRYFGKVLARRAAEPYMQAVVSEMRRANEFKVYAQTLLGKARSVAASADELVVGTADESATAAPHSPLGNIDAFAEEQQAQTLLRKSRKLELEAGSLMKRADAAYKQAARFQHEGMSIAASVAQRYEQARMMPDDLLESS